MNGLGIVIEEKEMETDPMGVPDKRDGVSEQTPFVAAMVTPESESEILLPPLPDKDAEDVSGTLLKEHKASVATSISNESCLSMEETETDKESQFNEFLQNPTYELSSPNLNIDPLFANLALNEAQQQADQTTGMALNTSPLKRFKKIKKGIRKLSLSKMNTSLASSVAAGSPSATRPSVNPLVTTGEQGDSFLSVSTNESYQMACKKKSNLITPMTTPISSPVGSPIITLSENLSSSSKNIVELERNFFRSLNTGDSNTEVSSMADLTKLDDLINYLNFLNLLKVQVIDAFELTKERLVKFGWCSDDDLNNLQFQKDSSLLQIDTRILQVEKKLNKQYNTSILICSNNRVSRKSNSVSSYSSSIDNFNYASENSKASSLSLKNLENRCFSYPDL